MKIVAIIQARMTSTRLPGKVLMQVMNKPLLAYQLERVKSSKFIDEIVVATTLNDTDIPIVELCEQLSISCYRGSELDVLSRYYEAAIEYKADIIVRLTSDCPLIDPEIIDQVINYYLNNNYDYVSNTQVRSFPRGMDTEVFSLENLELAFSNGNKDYEREHVTPYFYLNKELFSIGQVIHEADNSNFRLTVDTREDLELITILLKKLYLKNGDFGLNNIIEELEKDTSLAKINAHIEQKKLGE